MNGPGNGLWADEERGAFPHDALYGQMGDVDIGDQVLDTTTTLLIYTTRCTTKEYIWVIHLSTSKYKSLRCCVRGACWTGRGVGAATGGKRASTHCRVRIRITQHQPQAVFPASAAGHGPSVIGEGDPLSYASILHGTWRRTKPGGFEAV